MSSSSASGPEYWVDLDVFEGPLDLLLHIIRKHELDILDIPVAFVLERYLEYLETMQELELDLASEYLSMAATLVYIKSRMLLPDGGGDEDEDEDGEIEDPRAELIRRLLEYKKYRKAAADLAGRSVLGHEIFVGGFEPDPMEQEIAEVGLFELIECVADLIKEAKARGRVDKDLLCDRITVAQRINEIADILATKRNATFRQLLQKDFVVFDVVITFLALLEMARLRMIRLVQEGLDAELLIVEPAPLDGQDLDRPETAHDEPGPGCDAIQEDRPRDPRERAFVDDGDGEEDEEYEDDDDGDNAIDRDDDEDDGEREDG